MRPDDVARLAGVPLASVRQTDAVTLRRAMADRAPAIVLEVATQDPATYWRVGDRYFLDDPLFGDVVELTNLDYDPEIGLHVRR